MGFLVSETLEFVDIHSVKKKIKNFARYYLRKALGATRRIDNRDLPINGAADLLALSHVIELGSADHAASGFCPASSPRPPFMMNPISAAAMASCWNWNEMTIKKTLNDALESRGVSPAQFSELMIRLLDHGVLCRDESKREGELYDRYLQIPELVEDYLAVLRIRLLHEPPFRSLRLFPPGAEVPGLPDSEESFNSGLRERLSQQEVATILAVVLPLLQEEHASKDFYLQ